MGKTIDIEVFIVLYIYKNTPVVYGTYLNKENADKVLVTCKGQPSEKRNTSWRVISSNITLQIDDHT